MDRWNARFSRKDLAARTGIDSSTLEYWLREGVIRPVSGGEGRGSRRLFTFQEVCLAGVLWRLKPFMENFRRSKQIAAEFHRAQDFVATVEPSLARLQAFEKLVWLRKHFFQQGSDWRCYVERQKSLETEHALATSEDLALLDDPLIKAAISHLGTEEECEDAIHLIELFNGLTYAVGEWSGEDHIRIFIDAEGEVNFKSKGLVSLTVDVNTIVQETLSMGAAD